MVVLGTICKGDVDKRIFEILDLTSVIGGVLGLSSSSSSSSTGFLFKYSRILPRIAFPSANFASGFNLAPSAAYGLVGFIVVGREDESNGFAADAFETETLLAEITTAPESFFASKSPVTVGAASSASVVVFREWSIVTVTPGVVELWVSFVSLSKSFVPCKLMAFVDSFTMDASAAEPPVNSSETFWNNVSLGGLLAPLLFLCCASLPNWSDFPWLDKVCSNFLVASVPMERVDTLWPMGELPAMNGRMTRGARRAPMANEMYMARAQKEPYRPHVWRQRYWQPEQKNKQ